MTTEKNSSDIKKVKKRRLKGVVVSNKMQKTVVVKVTRLKKHPKYKKYFRVSKKFKAHTDSDKYKIGDIVIIEETRPLSKEKKWRVVSLISSNETKDKNETNDSIEPDND